jgi:repressor LexA
MLTPRQHAVYEFIAGFLERKGHAPSYEEIRRHFGLRSLNAVAKLIAQLRRRGALRSAPFNAKRSLSPVRLRSVGTTRPRPAPEHGRGSEPTTLPLLGLIAAGRPIEAIENSEPVDVPASLLGPGERYVLRVRGDSMTEDGIHDRDLIVVREAREAQNGQTVVAVVDGEATLKRFFRQGARVELRPANAALTPLKYLASRVEIRGVLVGLLRRYS